MGPGISARAAWVGIVLLAVTHCSRFEAKKEEAASFVAPPLAAPIAWRDISLDGGAIRRVLVLPLADESGTPNQQRAIDDSLRDEVMKLRRFDVVQPDAAHATRLPDQGPKKTGRVDVTTIIELGRHYGVDAVIFGTIDHYRPYSPPSLGISASMIDVQTGKIIWEVRDFVDTSDRNAEVAIHDFFATEAAKEQTVMERELMSVSPIWFSRFAARRIVRTLLAAPVEPRVGS
jgi:hypothetical protein